VECKECERAVESAKKLGQTVQDARLPEPLKRKFRAAEKLMAYAMVEDHKLKVMSAHRMLSEHPALTPECWKAVESHDLEMASLARELQTLSGEAIVAAEELERERRG